MKTSLQYKGQALQLLPRGVPWPGDGSLLSKLLHAICDSFARVDARADDLLRESRVASVSELLDDWERDYGLPDECGVFVSAVDERKRMLRQKVLRVGIHTDARLIEIGLAHGQNIEIIRYAAGDQIPGHPEISPAEAAYVIRIKIAQTTVKSFRAGQNQAGDPLRSWGPPSLMRCEIERQKLAHKKIIWVFGGVNVSD